MSDIDDIHELEEQQERDDEELDRLEEVDVWERMDGLEDGIGDGDVLRWGFGR